MKSKSILIVEDEALLAISLKRLLEREGYKVNDILAYGEQVMDTINEDSPDMVLMDINLKGEMTGIDAVKLINCELDIPIIYMTAYSDEYTMNEAKETNPEGILQKPVTDSNLLDAIEKAIK